MSVLDIRPYCFGCQECLTVPCNDTNNEECEYKKECYLKTLDNLGELLEP